MATNSRPHFPFEVLLLIVFTLAALYITLMFVGPELIPQIWQPVPLTPQPTAPPTSAYVSDVIPAPAETLAPQPLDQRAQAGALAPIVTSTPTPIIFPASGPLPDLTVTGISDPVCVEDHIGDTTGKYMQFTIYVRNVGRVATRSFGPVETQISLILGQTYYSLAEWSAKFNGVVGNSNLKISNLEPGSDVSLRVVLDLKGNPQFGLQASVNSGANAIPEADTSNNTLTEHFSFYCY